MVAHCILKYLNEGRGSHPGSSQARWVSPPSRSEYRRATLSSSISLISRPKRVGSGVGEGRVGRVGRVGEGGVGSG